MSLSEAVLEIATDMEVSAKEWLLDKYSSPVAKELESFAKQLRRAVKAAEGSQPQQPPPSQGKGLPSLLLGLQNDATTMAGYNRIMVENAKKKLREDGLVPPGGMEMMEEQEPIQREVAGTAEKGEPLCVPVSPKAPLGARMHIPEVGVVELRADGKLHPVGGIK